MHPSNGLKALVGDVIGLLVFALAAWTINWYTIDDDFVYTLCFIALVAVGNMALALPARLSMMGTAAASWKVRALAAAGLVVFSLIVLCVDYAFITWALANIDYYLAPLFATFFTAIIWVGAYVVAWRPFLARRENSFISACVSLGLGCLSMFLFFASLFGDALLDASSSKVSFIRFAFSCVSFASVISAFLNQWSSRAERLRRIRGKRAKSEDIEVREFIPSEDISSAERFASKGMHLDRYVKNELESWLFARDCMCEAIARSTRFYGAYDDDRLVGFLLADEHGAEKPYARSKYARYHRFMGWVIGLIDKNDANDSYEAANARMLASVDPAPEVELVFFAADPDLQGKGIGTKLLGAFEADFEGKFVFLYTDDACTYQFYEHRGFTRAASETIEEEAPGGLVKLECMLYTKQL